MNAPPASEHAPDAAATAAAPPHHRERAPLFVLAGSLLLYFLRFGYDYGTSDQDEIIPYLLHRLDPTLFTQDWFVMTQSAGFGVRTYFVAVLHGLSLLLPVWLATLVLYVAVWLLIAAAVYALAHHFTRDRLTAAAAVVAGLVLTPQWTLGGNGLVHAMLVPSMVGWGLGLWGFVFFLRRRPLPAGVLLGLATWMQALVGLQLAGLLALTALWGLLRGNRRGGVRPLLVFGGIFFLSALPALGPLVYQQLTTEAAAGGDGQASLFYVMATFRNPHHYLFYAFPLRALIRFGVLAGLGAAAFVWLYRKTRIQHAGFLARLFASITLTCLLAFVFTEAIPLLSIAKLQLFKTTVLAKLLFVVLICGAISAVLPDAVARPLRRLMAFRRAGLALVLAAWCLAFGGIWQGVPVVYRKAYPLARQETSLAQVEAWARTQTPRNAVFAVPPSWSGFRSHAWRAIVINYKAFPFEERSMMHWFERLTDVAPVDLPERGSPALMDRLDDAFLRQPPPALRRLADRYAFNFVVRDRPWEPVPDGFEQAFVSGEWVVYRMVRAERLVP